MIDPVTFSVIWGGLLSAAAEMGVTLTRTAYSVAVREGSDFSTGVFDAEGNMVAQGDYSPGHLGSMAFAVRRMLPKNKLGHRILKRLKLYVGPEHPHQAQQPEDLPEHLRP